MSELSFFDLVKPAAATPKPPNGAPAPAPAPAFAGLDLTPLVPYLEIICTMAERQTLALEAIAAFVIEMRKERDAEHAEKLAQLAKEKAATEAIEAEKAAQLAKEKAAAEFDAMTTDPGEKALADLDRLTRPDGPKLVVGVGG